MTDSVVQIFNTLYFRDKRRMRLLDLSTLPVYPDVVLVGVAVFALTGIRSAHPDPWIPLGNVSPSTSASFSSGHVVAYQLIPLVAHIPVPHPPAVLQIS